MSSSFTYAFLDPPFGFRERVVFVFAEGDGTVDHLSQQACKTCKVDNVKVLRLAKKDAVDEEYEDMHQLSWNEIVSHAALLPSTYDLAPLVAERQGRIWIAVVADSAPEPVVDQLASLPSFNQSAAVAATRRKKDPPSKTATESKLVDAQQPNVADAILNGRPQALTGPPVGVYHPFSTVFQRRCVSSDDLASLDVVLITRFILASRRYYPSEHERQAALSVILDDFMSGLNPSGTFRPSKFFIGTRYFEPDAHVTVKSDVILGHQMCALLGELKNGVGSGGCDPLEQATHGYRKLCSAPELDPLRLRTTLPAFLLSIAGSQLVIAGAVFADRVIVGRLTDVISLVPVQQSEHLPVGLSSSFDMLVDRVGKVLRALRDSIHDLQQWYASPQIATMPLRLPQIDPWPLLTSVGNYKIVYRERIARNIASRAIFIASVIGNDIGDKRCIVKFAPRYDGESHRLLYENEAAPLLYYCDWSDSVGQMVIIYEYIEGLEREPEPDEIDKLRVAVAALHKAGRVHGDLRPPNILVTKGKLMVIDYDWAGLKEQVTYPADINLSEECGWHSEVRSFGKIMAQHDDWLVNKLADASVSSHAHLYE